MTKKSHNLLVAMNLFQDLIYILFIISKYKMLKQVQHDVKNR